MDAVMDNFAYYELSAEELLLIDGGVSAEDVGCVAGVVAAVAGVVSGVAGAVSGVCAAISYFSGSC